MARSKLADPIELVETLSSSRIRAELAKLGRREAALRVLLRSALAREQHQQHRSQQEDTHAPR